MNTLPLPASPAPLRVLLVEDDRYDVEAFRRALRRGELSYDILNVTRAEDALVHLRDKSFDLVVVDNRLPGMSGLELCRQLVAGDPEFALVLLTGTGSEEIAVEALKAGVHEYLVKESGPGYLELLATVLPKAVQRVRETVARRRAEREVQESARRLRQVIDLVPHMIFARDLEGRYLLANRAAADACGTSVEVLMALADGGRPGAGEQLRRMACDDPEVIATQQPKFIPEEDFVDHRGERRILQTTKIPFTESGSTVPAVLSVSIDITAHKRAEQELFEEKERAQVTLHSIGDAVITTSPEGRVEFLNPAAEAMTGWSLEEARGRPLGEVFRVVDERTREPVPDPVARCLEQRRTVEMAQYSVLISRNGQEYGIQDSASPIRGRLGRVLGVVLVFNDVTEARRNARRMAHLATHDPLTGLVNRREFERRLERALRASAQSIAQHALCFLDLDHFKSVNDSVGHAAGDQLLKRISALLGGRIRSRDTLARLGGDEFGLLLENCPLPKATEIAQELVAGVRQLRFGWQGRIFQVGVSIGVVPISPAAGSTEDLLRWGDEACYVAKDLGRNRVHVGRGDGVAAGSARVYSADLTSRLRERSFRLLYQPILPLAGGPPADYEVLLRLEDARGDLLLPEAFLPVAERNGLMVDVDRWVVEQACQQLAGVLSGASGPGMTLNLSEESLLDDSMPAFLQEQLACHGISARRVCFEISESVAARHSEQLHRVATALRQRGCRLALDDFGQSFASLIQLQQLPFDYLKIDASVVCNLVHPAANRSLVAAIHHAARALGLRTIAEGAETLEIVDSLRSLGVDYAQGFALGAPRPLGDLTGGG